MVVSDNLRSGITKACFYEPAVNRTYAEMAAHYNTTILPARPYRPRDKAKVEVGVQVTTRFIIAKLRNRQFFSLSALNAAIAELVPQINDRVSRHLGASRRALFEELERPALKPLPAEPYVLPNGRNAGSGSTTTSRSRSTITRCRTSCCARRFGRASRRARSKSSTAASALPHMCARPPTASIRRCASTCRRAIGAMLIGRRSDFGGRPARSAVNLGTGRDHPARTHAPRARLPRLYGHPAARQELWSRAARSRLLPRARDRGALLQLSQLDPEEQPRSPTA